MDTSFFFKRAQEWRTQNCFKKKKKKTYNALKKREKKKERIATNKKIKE